LGLRIEKAETIGFCFGVRRAIDTLEQIVREKGGIETLGDLVHNRQVLKRLSGRGVSVVNSIEEIKGDTIIISAHGVGPQVIEELIDRNIKIIDTTCSFVKRAQNAASKLAEKGFYTIVYGDAAHSEVKGILGWAGGFGMATQDAETVITKDDLPLKLGLLSQTTQKPASFNNFAKDIIDSAMVKDSELRLIDTVCHDIRKRQADVLALAKRVDMVFVIGGNNSANTRHLLELCSTVKETRQVERPQEIKAQWLKGKKSVGIAAGASTDADSIEAVIKRLKELE
jgi:4-hydroxy-3-methylbut-2-enyl diphosphate reductase